MQQETGQLHFIKSPQYIHLTSFLRLESRKHSCGINKIKGTIQRTEQYTFTSFCTNFLLLSNSYDASPVRNIPLNTPPRTTEDTYIPKANVFLPPLGLKSRIDYSRFGLKQGTILVPGSGIEYVFFPIIRPLRIACQGSVSREAR